MAKLSHDARLNPGYIRCHIRTGEMLLTHVIRNARELANMYVLASVTNKAYWTHR